MLNVSLVCSSKKHPIYPVLEKWTHQNRFKYNIELVDKAESLRSNGDFLFLVSCSEIIDSSIRNRFKNTLVLHASDLPNGKGWSPHIWELLNGASFITVSLLEAEDSVDSGKIWTKRKISIEEHELHDEINKKLFDAEIELIEVALRDFDVIVPESQSTETTGNYYRKRTPEDSRLDISKSLQSQFNLLRVCDPERFPAFFEFNGHKYTLQLTKDEVIKDE